MGGQLSPRAILAALDMLAGNQYEVRIGFEAAAVLLPDVRNLWATEEPNAELADMAVKVR